MTPDQAILQTTLAAVRLNQSLATLSMEASAPVDSYFLTAKEMEERFHQHPEALAATIEIAERCTFDLPICISQMPTVPLQDGVPTAAKSSLPY